MIYMHIYIYIYIYIHSSTFMDACNKNIQKLVNSKENVQRLVNSIYKRDH